MPTDFATAYSDNDESVAHLQLQVQSLAAYKINYELLCRQLEALNAQIGLQLEQHESDVTTLSATITSLQHSNHTLEHELHDSHALLAAQQQLAEKDRTDAKRVRTQLRTSTELLSATEQRVVDAEQELASCVAAATQLTARIHTLEAQCTAMQQHNDGLQHRVEQLELQRRVDQRESEAALRDAVAQRERLEATRRKEMTALRNVRDRLASDLETQRARTRMSKKHATDLASECDALRKQLQAATADSDRLSAVVEQQRHDAQRATRELGQHKQQLRTSDAAAQNAAQHIARLQNELLRVTESLVDQNAAVDALQTERRALQTAQQQHLQAADAARHAQRDDRAQLHALLAINHDRTHASAQDVQSLKRDLVSVQEQLRAHRQQQQQQQQHNRKKGKSAYDRWRDDLSIDSTTTSLERARSAANRVEASVLQCAIASQVEAASRTDATVEKAAMMRHATTTRRQSK